MTHEQLTATRGAVYNSEQRELPKCSIAWWWTGKSTRRTFVKKKEEYEIKTQERERDTDTYTSV